MKANANSIRLSIIIPVLNEEAIIEGSLAHLKNACTENSTEILVVDGGSSDDTVTRALESGVKVVTSEKGRALQMNYGAQLARGEILYFLHADTLPPEGFDKAILDAVDNQDAAGCFQMKFDSDSRFLNFFAWFTRINHRICRGGDQSLFISKLLFDEIGGFDENFLIYEDTEFIGRLYRQGSFRILPQKVVTSARRYRQNGAVKLQYHFGMIHLKHLLGAGPKELHDYYQRHIAS